MDRFICHAIQSCRECTWTHSSMQARRKNGRTKMWPLRGGGGGGSGGGGGRKGLNVGHYVHQFVRGISPLPPPYPPYHFSLPLPQSTSNDSQINKSRHQWVGETHWQVDQSTGSTTTPATATVIVTTTAGANNRHLSERSPWQRVRGRFSSVLTFLWLMACVGVLLSPSSSFLWWQQWQELSFVFREVSRVGGGGGVSQAGHSPT